MKQSTSQAINNLYLEIMIALAFCSLNMFQASTMEFFINWMMFTVLSHGILLAVQSLRRQALRRLPCEPVIKFVDMRLDYAIALPWLNEIHVSRKLENSPSLTTLINHEKIHCYLWHRVQGSRHPWYWALENIMHDLADPVCLKVSMKKKVKR